MKTLTTYLVAFTFIIGLNLQSNIALSKLPGVINEEKLSGVWLGELVIPNMAKLRFAIIVSTANNNSYKAVLNIIDQATGDIPCDKMTYRNDSVLIAINGLGIQIAGLVDPEFKTMNSNFRQAGTVFPVLFNHVDKLPELLRPQEPKQPFPYNEETVVFENKKAAITLAGTLTYPKSKGPYPAVILVTGSGKQDRNEEMGKHKPFLVIADYLTRKGIAVLRVDDRGIGGSTGNFEQSTTDDFAEDVLAGITFLKSRKEINPKKIGIIGHSEGGLVAPLAATKIADVAFIVSLAGVFTNFEDVVTDQIINQLTQEGVKDEDIQLERTWRKKIYSLAKEPTDSLTAAKKLWDIYNELTKEEITRLNWPKGRQEAQIKQVLSPWWRYLLALDNKAVLMKVKCPMLAMYGQLDQQVNPGKNIPIVEESMKEGGNKSLVVKSLPGLNHLFQTATTGSEYEYIRIEETVSPLALETMSSWVLNQVGN